MNYRVLTTGEEQRRCTICRGWFYLDELDEHDDIDKLYCYDCCPVCDSDNHLHPVRDLGWGV